MKGQISYVDDYNENMYEQPSTVPFSDNDRADNVVSFPSNDVSNEEVQENEDTSLKKATIIPFRKKQVESITLNEWLMKYHLPDELQDLFVNMDLAMKYIHDQGYYITSFALDSIELLNNSIKQVKFDQLSELPSNFSDQKKIIHDNIFLSAVLQIGVYANCLQYFTTETMEFLKENFESFSIFLPENDVPYYKGIIERGASVYLSSYVGERKKRDLLNLNKEVSDGTPDNSKGKTFVKTNGIPADLTAEDLVPPNKANEIIYANLAKKDAAFVRALIYPILILLLGLTVLLLSYILA